jgi:hypothetical protein
MADSDAVQQNDVVSEYMLTTVDNPFNPFEQWDEWFSYDETMGYHTCALLARVTYTSDELSESDQDLAVQLAVHEVARENVSGMHRKVSRETFSAQQ